MTSGGCRFDPKEERAMIHAPVRELPGRCLLVAGLWGMLISAHGQTPESASPENAATQRVETDTFREPRPKDIPEPIYPFQENMTGEEGWVILSMMVNAQGKPFEVGVVRSTGNKTFEKLAVKSMEHASLYPGTVNNAPVESVFEIRYTFQNPSYTPGAHPEFIAAYKALGTAINKGDRVAADVAMKGLQVKTLYEDAYYGVAQYKYALRWGDANQQEKALWRALGGASYLSRDLHRVALLANLDLQLQKHDYSEVLRLWELLSRLHMDKDTQARWAPVIEQVKQLRTQTASYTMSGTITDLGSWGVQLFRRNFRATALSGALSRVKLKCARGLVTFTFDPALTYNVAEKYGNCRLELEGTPGTEITLTQS
jgi:TonB family protein